MACKYIYKGTTYSSKEEFISKVIPTLQNKSLSTSKKDFNLKEIEKDFQNYNEHPDVDYYLKGNIGKVTDSTLTNLCDVTANICITYLYNKGINVLQKAFHIYPTLKVANFEGDFVNHKVAISYINDKMYIFDMPQNEYITLNKEGKAVFGEFKPRFIEVTPENMQKYYGIDKESYNNTFFGTTPSRYIGNAQTQVLYKNKEYINFQGNISDYFKQGSPTWSESDFKRKFFNKEDLKPTYTFNSEVIDYNKDSFLHLLSRDNNWVTFFVKSIIQDSAKKGYEKVLFPRLDTIIQVESQNKFKTYAEAEAHYKDAKWYEEDKKLRKVLAAALDKPKEEQNQEHILRLKEQIAAHQPSLLNTAKFYEYELANRLDDIVGGNKNNRAKGIWALNQITDEYGNTWNEVEIKLEHLEPILAAKNETESKFKELIKLNKTQVSDLNKAIILTRVKAANAELGTSYYVHFNQIGQSDNYTWVIENKAKKEEQLDLFNENTEDYVPDLQEQAEVENITPEKVRFANPSLNSYFKGAKSAKASDILPLLYPRTKNGFFANLIKQILPNLKNDVVIKVMSPKEFNEYAKTIKSPIKASETDGIYNPNTNEVIILDRANSEEIDRIILHEVLHAITYDYLRQDNKLAAEFKDLFKKAKTLMTKEERATYPMSNLDEFFAGLSSPKFIKLLASKKSVNSEGKTIWESLKQLLSDVLKTLGIDIKGTLLEDYFNLTTSIIEDANNATEESSKEILPSKTEDKTINIQDSNLKSLEKSNKTISVREVGEHGYVKGDILTVKVNGKDTDIKVKVRSVRTVEDFTKLTDREKDEFAKSIGNYVDFEDFKQSDDYANETSPQSLKYPHIYKFINGQVAGDIISYRIVEKSIVDQESPYKKIQIYLTRKLKRLEKELTQIPETSFDYEKKSNEIKAFKEKLAGLVGSKDDKDVYKEFGLALLEEADDLLITFEDGKIPETKDLAYIQDLLEAWDDFSPLAEQLEDIRNRYSLLVADYVLENVKKHSTNSEDITKAKLDKDTKDIGTITMATGALADSVNLIASTIGSIIRKAQNLIETKDKRFKKEIQTEIDALNEYAKKNGVTLDELYETTFIQQHKKTTILTKPYLENQDVNPNYEKIQNTPELKQFYDFYQKHIQRLENVLPISFGKYFIPNIARKKTIKEEIKGLNPIKERKVGFSFDEENKADIIETKYDVPLASKDKETNLGEILFKFGKYAHNYEEMAAILPETRLLQEQLTYKINSKGERIERRFINPSDPSKSVTGKQSKIWKQVDGVINMQVKGNMKKTDEGKPKLSTTEYDKDGNPSKESYVDITGTLDKFIKYNSLLRIGFAPINAITNALFGDFSNAIEAIGGRFFGVKELGQATSIFIKQTLDKESVLNNLIIELNFLQELDSYELEEQIRLTGKNIKMSKEKLLEYAYSMQKSGEKYLQSRSAMAIMIKDGYLTPSGKLTEKYTQASPEEKTKLTDKIHKVNQQLHGRYSNKEAAVAQQYILYRLASQFRKWMISGYENRFNRYNEHDQRLGVDTEGRYITLARLIKDLKGTVTRIKEGKLSDLEKYNIRKTLAEATLLLATFASYALLRGDDDDKNRRKNPAIKTLLTLLNRTAGDLEFFYNPKSVTGLGTKILPSAKTADDLLTATYELMFIFGEDNTIKQGPGKGSNKFLYRATNLIPLVKPIKDVKKLVDDSNLIEY